MKNLTLDIIMSDTLWVAKMQSYRTVGTYDEIHHFAEQEDCRDFDTVCTDGQPDHLKPFYEAYYEHCRTKGWATIQDYYHEVWEKEHPVKTAKVWAPEEIKSLIQTNDTVLYRALKRLYAEQTDDEQFREHTVERNGRGFNKVDADFLTSVSKFLNSRGFLTEKQKVATRRKLIKYNAQLTRLANEGRC